MTAPTSTAAPEQRAPAPRADVFSTLGQKIPDGLSISEALEFAGMANWNVRKVPHSQTITLPDGTTTEVSIPHTFTVLRDNPSTGLPDALGSVGRKWTPYQNEDCANLLSDLHNMSGATPYSFGATNGGRKTFLSLKLPEGFNFRSPVTGNSDLTNLYLVVFNSHDGFGSLSANLTPIRMFCCNQQRMAESMARSRMLLRHTGDAETRLQMLREVLDESFSYHHTYQLACEAMIEAELDGDAVLAELNKLLRANDPDLTDRQRELRADTVGSVRALYEGSPTVAPFYGTRYGLYNAITEYTDHHMRVIVPDGGNEREIRALRTLNNDQLDSFKQRAFAQLMPADVGLTD